MPKRKGNFRISCLVCFPLWAINAFIVRWYCEYFFEKPYGFDKGCVGLGLVIISALFALFEMYLFLEFIYIFKKKKNRHPDPSP